MTARDAVTLTLACVFKNGQSDGVAGIFFSNDQKECLTCIMHAACMHYLGW